MATARITPVKGETIANAATKESVFESFFWLTCRVNVEIPVPGFTVGDLLRVTPGMVVRSATASTEDVCVRINDILLGSGEFEVLDESLAVRITEFV